MTMIVQIAVPELNVVVPSSNCLGRFGGVSAYLIPPPLLTC